MSVELHLLWECGHVKVTREIAIRVIEGRNVLNIPEQVTLREKNCYVTFELLDICINVFRHCLTDR